MHVHTHLMSGWIAGNLPDLTVRERFLCMVAAGAADLDGLGILYSREAYECWHHTLGHNLPVGAALSVALSVLSVRRGRAFVVYLGCFHLHLLMDLLGSGADWGIPYLWPFSEHVWQVPFAWELYSWQNTVTGMLCLAVAIRIALRQGRTPIEWLVPGQEPAAVAAVQRLFKGSRRV